MFFPFSWGILGWFSHHFPVLVPRPFGVAPKEIVEALWSQNHFVAPHHKLQLLGPRVDERCPCRLHGDVRAVPGPHPHPLAVTSLARLAKVGKGLGDGAEVVRVDALEDALPDDVLVEEAGKGDGCGVEPAERVVRLVLGPEVTFAMEAIQQRSNCKGF